MQAVRLPAAERATLTALGVADARVEDYGSFVWVKLSGAERAQLKAQGVRASADVQSGLVQVNRFLFDPITQGEPVSLAKSSAEAANGEGFRLVQFEGPVRDAWLKSLQDSGIRPLQYYPHNTYLVWSEGAALQRLESLSFVRWHGDFHADYKLNSDVLERTGRIDNVSIVFFAEGDAEATIAQLRGLGADVLDYHPAQPDRAFFEAIARVDASTLPALAQVGKVLWMGYSHPTPVLEDEMSDQILAGNHPGGTPVTGYNAYLSGLGYDGSGVRWAVVDTGVDYDHPDLGPSIVEGTSFPGACAPAGQPGSDCSGGGHGTHVAGIIGGTAAAGLTDGAGFLYGLGVAPGYDIVAMNSLSGPSWPPAGGWQEHSRVALSHGAIGSNNSWTTGEGTAHGYQASERTHDLIVLDGDFSTAEPEPIILVYSAGNSGSGASTLTSPKESKNMISVASSRNARVGSIDTISGFSSRGPAVDGRILPTIAAPGEQIASSRNDLGGSCSTAISGTSNLYAFCSGTSMASPHVSGVLTVAAEWWRDMNAGADFSPAMAKALLVNSAIDIGTPDRPNNIEGWGRVSLERLIVPTQPRLYVDQTEVLADPGDFYEITVAPADSGTPVEISLAWSDAPGAIGANPALVNNLDLVVNDDGTPYLGNVFSAGWSMTGGTADTISNVENVFIQSPSGNAITVRVEATNIAGDGVPNNGDATDQTFALVCTNCVQNPDYTLSVDTLAFSVCAPNSAAADITVGQLLGYTDPVALSVLNAPANLSTVFGDANPTPPATTTLTLGNTAMVAPGSYAMQLQAVSTSATRQRDLSLDLFDAAPVAPSVTAPAPAAVDVPLSPMLSWTAPAQVAGYVVEIATDAGFGNIVYSASEAGTTHQVTATLEANTEYFWRVRADNACGSSPTAGSSFTTVNISCSTFTASGLPLPIPATGTSGTMQSTLSVGGSGAITDVNVVGLTGTHTYMGDLDMVVSSPTGTNVTVMNQTCGTDENFNINFDDAAPAGSWPCPPVDGGTYRPFQALSAFNGEASDGTWTLQINDNAGGDSGSLTGWGLEICREGTSQPLMMIFRSGFEG